MPALRDLQRDFAYGVLTADFGRLAPHVTFAGIPVATRLGIYRNNVRAVLTQSLRLSFPATERIVGAAFFEHAAARFIEANPPRAARLARYGGAFPAFLAALPEAAGIGYLGAVAAYEWARATAAHADDTAAVPIAALARIPARHHGAIRLRAHPSVSVLHPPAPVDRITAAVLADDEAAMRAIDLADIPPGIIVHRGQTIAGMAAGVSAERLGRDAAALLPRLFAGAPLGRLAEDGGPGFAALLAAQFAAGRIAGYTIGAEP